MRSKEGRWWSVRLRPYKTTDNKIDGVVIAAMDIDALKHNVQLANEGREFAEAVLDTVRQPMLALDRNLAVQFINPAFCRAFKVSAQEALGTSLYKLGDGRWDVPTLRRLIEQVLAREGSVSDFEVQHEVPGLGHQRLRLSARRVDYSAGKQQLTLLAIETIEAEK